MLRPRAGSSCATSRISLGAQAWYFCVGGAEEFLDGGVHSEHAIFVATGRPDPRREQRMIELINRFDRVLTMGTSTRAALKRHGATRPIEPVGVGIDVQRKLTREQIRRKWRRPDVPLLDAEELA